MLKEGKDRQEAEAAIELLMEVIDYFQDASLKLQTQSGLLNLSLDVGVKQ